MKALFCFLMLGFFLLATICADLPQFPKYPDLLKKATWDAQKTLSLKLKAKKANLHGMGSAMQKAEQLRTALNPFDYLLPKTKIVTMTRPQIEAQYRNQILALWNLNIKALLEALKPIELKVEEYLTLIGTDTYYADSRKYLNEVKAAVIDYMSKVQGFDEGNLVAEWIKSTLAQWRILTGQAHIDIAMKNMRDLEGFSKTVKTIDEWGKKGIQSQSIRAIGTATPHLKKILGDSIVAKWKACSSDPWQPKADSEVDDKFTELLKLITETKEKLAPMDDSIQ